MNKAQKLLQPLIDLANKGWTGITKGYSLGVIEGLETASRTLATLTDTITLADVPTPKPPASRTSRAS